MVIGLPAPESGEVWIILCSLLIIIAATVVGQLCYCCCYYTYKFMMLDSWMGVRTNSESEFGGEERQNQEYP